MKNIAEYYRCTMKYNQYIVLSFLSTYNIIASYFLLSDQKLVLSYLIKSILSIGQPFTIYMSKAKYSCHSISPLPVYHIRQPTY